MGEYTVVGKVTDGVTTHGDRRYDGTNRPHVLALEATSAKAACEKFRWEMYANFIYAPDPEDVQIYAVIPGRVPLLFDGTDFHREDAAKLATKAGKWAELGPKLVAAANAAALGQPDVEEPEKRERPAKMAEPAKQKGFWAKMLGSNEDGGSVIGPGGF